MAMRKFNIQAPDKKIVPALQDKIDNLTKPKGSLGRLEELAVQIGTIQQTLSPVLRTPQNIVFAADHGIVAEGVSFSAPEVTAQQIYNFLEGGGGINMFARQHHFILKVVDCGVNADFGNLPGLIHRKIRKSTSNYLHEAAMSPAEMEQAIEIGAEMVRLAYQEGTNIISFGELGMANTSASSIWMSYFTGIPLKACVGAGSGLDSQGIAHKYQVLQQAMNNYRGDGSTTDILRWFGGFEMVAAVGAMLQAAELKMTVIIDGFIMTNCILAASKLYPEVLEYCVFGHQGDEAGHRLVLEALHAKPLLHLNLRLGEGTGAICAYPIIESAIHMINEMRSFKEAAVTKYF